MMLTKARYCLSLLALLAVPAQAETVGRDMGGANIEDTDRGEDSPLYAEFAAYQAKDQHLQDIGWRLVTGNARFCDETLLSSGLQLIDMASFRSPAKMRAALGLTGDFAVQTAAKNSPAAKAGLAALNEVSSLGGSPLNAWPVTESFTWQRLTRAHDAIDENMAETGQVRLTLADGSEVVLGGVPACASRFELATGHGRALAEGKRVIIGEEFVGLSFPEEELAAVIAHELAHNVLGHRAWLDENGRKRRFVRATEREADRLMPWLLANAGYPPEAALRFMNRWGPNHSRGFLLRARSHEGWDERAEHIEAEVAQVRAALSQRGAADWQTYFRREVTPDGKLANSD